jgi:hypothetical protein
VERASELDDMRAALPGAEITVIRVHAPPEVCAERLRHREISPSLRERHIRRSPVLARALEELAVEDFSVVNDARPIREVALEVLDKLGWTAGAALH